MSAAEKLERLREATTQRRQLDGARATEHAAIVAAMADPGVRQRDVVAVTGFSREYIRRIVRKAGQ